MEKLMITYWIEPYTSTVFVWINGGEFLMGSPDDENGRQSDEPIHKVYVDGFWVSEYKITNYAYWKMDRKHDSGEHWVTGMFESQKISLNKDHYPAVRLTWEEARCFANWLSDQYNYQGSFRLPTEAEWEYCCRAGTNSPYYFGDDPSLIKRHRLYINRVEAEPGNEEKSCSGIWGAYERNPWGLRGLIGSIGEWCEDTYDENAYLSHSSENPVYLLDGAHKVARGGLRSANRKRDKIYSYGMRLVLASKDIPPGGSRGFSCKSNKPLTVTMEEFDSVVNKVKEEKLTPPSLPVSVYSRRYHKERQYRQCYGIMSCKYCGRALSSGESSICNICLSQGAR